MALFKPGPTTTSTQAPQMTPAEQAARLFAIQLLLGKLVQTGGAPQTFDDYIKNGPQKLPADLISGAGSRFMNAVSAPGAMNVGPTTSKTTGASPSTFQDLTGGLFALALLGNMIGGGGGGGLLGGGGGSSPSTGSGGILASLFGGGGGGSLPVSNPVDLNNLLNTASNYTPVSAGDSSLDLSGLLPTDLNLSSY